MGERKGWGQHFRPGASTQCHSAPTQLQEYPQVPGPKRSTGETIANAKLGRLLQTESAPQAGGGYMGLQRG